MAIDANWFNSDGMRCKCAKCGHEWWKRAKKPVQCPRCKTYKWENK